MPAPIKHGYSMNKKGGDQCWLCMDLVLGGGLPPVCRHVFRSADLWAQRRPQQSSRQLIASARVYRCTLSSAPGPRSSYIIENNP